MKKLFTLISMVLLVITASFSVACAKVKFDVEFMVDGEVYYTIETDGKSKISMPSDPTKEGMVFEGWYWDNNVWSRPFTVNSLLDAPLSDNLKVYAHFVTPGEAPDSYTQGLQFTLQTTTNSYALSGYIGTSTNVIIPSMYNGGQVTSISPSAFESNYSIKSVVIPDTVVVVGADAFSECHALETVTISKNLQILGGGAFSNCINLKNITIPNSLQTVGSGAFENCNSLTEISLPATKPLKYYFGNDVALIPNSLKTVKINETATSICEEFCYKASSVTTVYVPKNVTTIEFKAFVDMPSLASVYYDATLVTSSGWAFMEYFRLEHGIHFSTNKITLYVGSGVKALPADCFAYSSVQEVVFAEDCNIEVIGDGCFWRCDYLEEISFPSSVTEIKASAFLESLNLKKVKLSSSLKEIGASAFSRCSLTEISLPDSLETIGAGAFLNNYITEVIIPDSVMSIGESAFYGMVRLYKIVIGKKVQVIEEYAFQDCYNLTEVYNLSSLNIVAGDTSFGGVALYASEVKNSLNEPSSIIEDENGFKFAVKDGDYYLVNVSNLEAKEDLVLPNGVLGNDYIISGHLFINNTTIKSLTINGGVKLIGNSAFMGCTSLKTVSIYGCKNIGENAFRETPITKVVLGEGVEVVGISAFQGKYTNSSGCEETELIIGNTVTTIKDYAFSKLNMSIITIPGNVKTIGKGAFLYNHATEIYVLDGVEDIGEGAFENCYFLTKIEIPASVKKIGKLAFYGDGTLSTNCQIYYAGTEHYFKKIGGNAEGSTLIALVTGFTVKALYTDGTPVDGTLGWDGEKTSNVNVVFTEVKNQGLHPVINSQVIQKYDKNQAIYNESTSSWEIHTATDYSAELGQNVFAVDYGTIVNIYNELLWGDIIVLETVGNLTIYYKGVMANSNVLVGSEVVKGQVIGTVSSNGAHEGYLGTHIHVEVSTKEGSVDLEKYLILGDSYKAVSLNSEGTCLYLDPCSAVAEKYKVTIENLPVGYTADEIYVDYTNYEIIFVVKET